MQIFDLYGKIVSTKRNSTTNNEINISNLSQGVYFLKFENGSIHKFIKK
ncbi:T9SS type A sorting domain-containing protein [uncultured Dokdonia sp.]|nr:T9SS type A sorting domain-containing protein [uncultured Dokdonia sp.]